MLYTFDTPRISNTGGIMPRGDAMRGERSQSGIQRGAVPAAGRRTAGGMAVPGWKSCVELELLHVILATGRRRAGSLLASETLIDAVLLDFRLPDSTTCAC